MSPILLLRYQYSFGVGLFVCITWCTVICLSRLYLGMHSVLVSSCLIISITLKISSINFTRGLIDKPILNSRTLSLD